MEVAGHLERCREKRNAPEKTTAVRFTGNRVLVEGKRDVDLAREDKGGRAIRVLRAEHPRVRTHVDQEEPRTVLELALSRPPLLLLPLADLPACCIAVEPCKLSGNGVSPALLDSAAELQSGPSSPCRLAKGGAAGLL